MTHQERTAVSTATRETSRAAGPPEEPEVLFRQIADNVREIFWIFTPDFDRRIYVSPAYEQLWGRPVDEVYERTANFMEAVHPEDQEGVAAAMHDIRLAPQEDVEFRIVQPDGSVRWALARGYPVWDETGRVDRVVGTTRDVTDRKEAEAKVRSAEAHYRWLVENTPYAIYALDANGCFIELNPAGESFVGRPAEEVMGKHFSR